MTAPDKTPPPLPGEVWRGELLGCTFAIDGAAVVHCWWPEVHCWWPERRAPVGWDQPLPPTDHERLLALRAWAAAERARAERAEALAAAERAYRVAIFAGYSGPCDEHYAGDTDPACPACICDARVNAAAEALRKAGGEP